jgi:hypothetical protein
MQYQFRPFWDRGRDVRSRESVELGKEEDTTGISLRHQWYFFFHLFFMKIISEL